MIVMPTLLDLPPRLRGQVCGGVWGVFHAVFGHPAFIGLERPGCIGKLDGLGAATHKRHFDALLIGLPTGLITKVFRQSIAL